jgi:LysM repeat protein
MFIHTVKASETLYHIARKYGVPVTKIIETNGISDPDRLSVGEKLVIFTPTRTYTVRGGDTLEKISRRFSVPIKDIKKNNPSLMGGDKIYPEQLLTLKQDSPRHGTALVNGYYYKGCPKERLLFAVSHLNYLTVSLARCDGTGKIIIENDKEPLSALEGTGCLPILRLYDKRGVEELKPIWDSLTSTLLGEVKGRGYRGITLALYTAARDAGYAELILSMRRKAIAEGLLIFIELDGNKDTTFHDLADGYVLQYEKCALEDIPSFSDGERRIYTEFAEKFDAQRTFMDLSPYAYAEGEAMTHTEAMALAYRMKREIFYDEGKKTLGFNFSSYSSGKTRESRVSLESPENITAKLQVARELGYMGISYDIMRAPIWQMMLVSATFSPAIDYMSDPI